MDAPKPLNLKNLLGSLGVEAAKGIGRVFVTGTAFAGYAELVNVLSRLPSSVLRDALKIAEDREAAGTRIDAT